MPPFEDATSRMSASRGKSDAPHQSTGTNVEDVPVDTSANMEKVVHGLMARNDVRRRSTGPSPIFR